MKLMRTVRRVDDLLEVLIFDVALGTSRGRRFVAAIAAVSGLCLYLLAGMIAAPVMVYDLDGPLSTAPYVDGATWTPSTWLIDTAAVDHAIPAGRRADLERDVAARAPALARLTALLAVDRPAPFHHTPWFHRAREAANLLMASALCEAAAGRRDRAAEHLLMAARLGGALTDMPAGKTTVIQGMVGVATEKRALVGLMKHFDAHCASSATQVAVERYFAARPADRTTLRAFLAGERAVFERHAAFAIQHGTLAHERGRWANAFLPARHADRAAFLTQVRFRVRAAYHALETRAPGAVTQADLDLIAGGGTPVTLENASLLRALFSRSHAVGVVARGVMLEILPPCEKAAERIAALDEVVAKARARAEVLDLEGI